MTPATVSYLTDFGLGALEGGLIAALTVVPLTGTVDWRAVAVAFGFGVARFIRKWISAHSGLDSVPTPQTPPPIKPLPPFHG